MNPHDSVTLGRTAEWLQLVGRLADVLDELPANDTPAQLRRQLTRALLRGRAALTTDAERDRDAEHHVMLMMMTDEEVERTCRLVAECPGKAVRA